MGYSIIYSTQFIKLDEERVLPIVLMGSSNVTMFYGGREIKEREWQPFCGEKYVGMTTKEIRNDLDKRTNYGNYTFDYEWFKTGSKWVMDSTILNWFDKQVKKAKTIEEIVELGGSPLKCYIYLEKPYNKYLIDKTCRTTKEIEEYISELSNYEVPKDTRKYANMGFYGIKPIKLNKKN